MVTLVVTILFSKAKPRPIKKSAEQKHLDEAKTTIQKKKWCDRKDVFY